MAGREAPPACIHGGRQALPCGRRAPLVASGTRGALKATTDGRARLHAGPGCR
jgi:hypothetical protein